MVHIQMPFCRLLGAIVCGCTVLVAGCSSSQQTSTSRSPALEQVTSTPETVRDTTLAVRYFIRGLSHVQKESYDTAILYYHRALPHTSDSAAVFASLAEAYDQQGSSESALSFARRAVAADPRQPSYHYQLATLQEESNDIAGAIATYRGLIERFPDETRAYYAVGKLYLRTDSLERAVETFQRVMRKPGQRTRAGYELLRIYRREENHAGMIRTLDVLIEAAPANPDLYFMLTDVHRENGDLQEAIEVLQTLRERLPDNAEAAFRLVELYHEVGASEKAERLMRETVEMDDLGTNVLYEQARSLYFNPSADRHTDQTVHHLLERVLEQSPGHGGALYMLGTIHLQKGANAKAFDLLERAVEETPRNQDAWLRALLAGVQDGKYDRVVELAEEALILFPRHFSILRLAGTACLRSNHDQMGIDYLSRALESQQAQEVGNDVRSNVASMLGILYNRVDETALADSLYEQALTWNSTNETALNNYAYSLAEREIHLERALEMAQKAVDLAPESASLMDTLGWVYFKMDRLNEAAAWIERAIETGRASADVHEHYGDVQRELGNDTEALEYWKKAARMNPDDEALREKIRKVESDE